MSRSIITEQSVRFNIFGNVIGIVQSGFIIEIFITDPQLELTIPQINIRKIDIAPVIGESEIIHLIAPVIQINVIVFKHIRNTDFPQKGITERIIDQYIRVFAQTSRQRQTRPSQRPMAQGRI